MSLKVWFLALVALACTFVHAERPFIAFASAPFKGHVTPVHALAQELSDRGYDTEFITMDSHITVPYARAPGPRYVSLFPFESICPPEVEVELFRLLNGVTHDNLAIVPQCLILYYERFLPAITHHFMQRRPDLVVSDYFTFPAIVSTYK